MLVFLKKRKIQKLQEKADAFGLFKIVYQENDPQVAQLAAAALGKMNDAKSIKVLAAALEDEQPLIRKAATEVLAQSSHEQSVPLLVQALQDSQETIRTLAAAGLGRTGNPQAIPPLLAMVSFPYGQDYTTALTSLALLGKTMPPAQRRKMLVEPLEYILRQTRIRQYDTGVETLEWMGWTPDTQYQASSEEEQQERYAKLRAALLNALVAMGWTPDQSYAAAEYWVMQGQWDRCAAIGEPAIDLLVALLKGNNETERQKSYLTLVQMGSIAAERLIAALQDDISDMRMAAFKALAKLGPVAIPQIIAALKDEYADVRAAAVRELGRLGNPIAIGPIIDAFSDGEPSVRREAQRAILTIGTPALGPLLSALRYNASSEVRWAAARTLETMGWRPAHDQHSAAYWIVKGEWDKCVEIGMTAVPVLLDLLDHWDSDMCTNALKTILRIGHQATEQLLVVLKAISPDVRLCSITLLESLVDADLSPAQVEHMLQVLLEDEENEDIAQHIIQFLEQLSHRKKKYPRLTVNDDIIRRDEEEIVYQNVVSADMPGHTRYSSFSSPPSLR